jgi:hypothetical protein
MLKGFSLTALDGSDIPRISDNRQYHRMFLIPIAGIMYQRHASDARMPWTSKADECPSSMSEK